MAGVWSDWGVGRALSQKQGWLNPCVLRLFQNNHVPSHSDTAAAYTEANFTGYAPITPLNFSNPAIDANGKGTITDVVRTFTCTGAAVGNTIFGYFVTDAGGNLVFAEQNAAGGFIMNAAGISYSVQLNVTDKVDPSP